ncbi:phosphodiester glycosidase family protein [Oleiagrimonas sp. MCCC 1A03011]|uniref:phosphodiester glycosidase family protein n=1 Tax=Oleiagrimonas sp. MCCC 1A03011 TaxID=1926883 RepID=UPI000DC284C7|nr:phosphodiester glycosidase family protein [Oleiagrimonas sp. MCCC 1A03011]RAP57410.1 hypothetical protein BTJ49_10050 [Oleiagrimonas sp. MCCC 1A03011]
MNLFPPRSRGRLLHRMLPALLLCAAALAGCGSRAAQSGEQVRFDGAVYRVVSVDLRHADLTLHWRDPDTGKPFADIDALREWGKRHGKVLRFAANAGIYDRKGAPLGLYVEDGKRLEPLNTAHGDPSAGNFSLRPNGVFLIDKQNHARVMSTSDYQTQRPDPRLATQSGPMLVIDGALNPHFIADSNSLKWRSGVCARSPDQVVFAISETPVNFHAFARLFRDRLGCRNALYLDGTISQFYDHGDYFGPPLFMTKPYAGMFAVFEDAARH